MKVRLVAHDIGSNAFGRAHVLSQLASRFAEVDIVGPSSTGEVWEPVRSHPGVSVRIVDSRIPSQTDLLQGDPDVLYAVKARKASLGAALKAGRSAGVPVVADVDDWELAFYFENKRWWLKQCLNLRDPNNFWSTLYAQRQVKTADSVTVVSTWLQKRFGGQLVVHARDGDVFDPRLFDRDQTRARLGFHDERVVLFMGSPKPHKGLLDIIEALDQLKNPELRFLIVGSGSGLPNRDYLTHVANQPFSDLPGLVYAADLVVLAQRPGPIANAQIPAKLFDAMAMGRCIVATDVSDIREFAGPDTRTVPPGDRFALRQAISELAADRSLSDALGANNRHHFMKNHSAEVVSKVLEEQICVAVRSRGSGGQGAEQVERGRS